MATTGFWPIRKSLKAVIDYADNPDKTTDRRFLDDDLFKALRYTEDDAKTDQKMYVTAINCPTKRAYEHMTATKQRYGKTGGVLAYHGYQSFRTDEVTPEQAHQIGLETARRMWGEDYEIVVTTHLNTDNLHNHIVVNSVSFRTGRKFENHQSDHYKLREISDGVCREHQLSVLPPSKFTGNRKKDYWVRKSGNLTHRDILRQDIEKVLPYCGNWNEFESKLHSLGYRIPRDQDYRHVTVIAPDWKKPIRLDTLGYTTEALEDRFRENASKEGFFMVRYTVIQKFKTTPLLKLEKQLNYEISHSKDTAVVLVDVLFFMLLELLKLVREPEQVRLGNIPRSPSFRQALPTEHRLMDEYSLLKSNDLHTEENILDFIDSHSEEIARLEAQRKDIRNSNRRPKTPEERVQKNAAAREISARLRPLRKDLKLAKSALERYPRVWQLLQSEHETERIARNRERSRER